MLYHKVIVTAVVVAVGLSFSDADVAYAEEAD